MTREEAIYKWVLPALENTWNKKKCGEIIKALEQEPFMNKPCVAHQICHEDKVKVLDKIYADIQRLRGCSCSCSDGIIDDVEDILDKYRESEDKA